MDSKPEQFLTSEKKNVIVDALLNGVLLVQKIFIGHLKVTRELV